MRKIPVPGAPPIKYGRAEDGTFGVWQSDVAISVGHKTLAASRRAAERFASKIARGQAEPHRSDRDLERAVRDFERFLRQAVERHADEEGVRVGLGVFPREPGLVVRYRGQVFHVRVALGR